MPSASLVVARDSIRAISLNQLPPEAWTSITGGGDRESGDVAKLFERVPWVYRAVQMRAQSLSALPFAVLKGDTEQDIDKIGFLRGFVQLLYRIEQSLLLYGAAYVLPERNRVVTRGLRWLSPLTIKPIFDKDKGLTGFERTLGNRIAPQTFKPDEIIYFWLPDAENELGPGKSPAYSALAAAGALHNIDKFTAAFFERGAINATLLQIEGNPPQTEMERLQAWWKRMLSGVKKAYETVAIRASVKPITVGAPPKDLAMPQLTKDKREDIATAFGVPYSLVFSNASNYATAQQDDLNFYTKTVIPEARNIQEAFNQQFFEPLGLRLNFQPERLEIFQGIESRKADKLVALLVAGVMTVNEVREQMELPPLPEEDEPEAAPIEEDASPAVDTPKPDEKAIHADKQRWQKKALKSLKDGKPAFVPFTSDVIPAYDHLAISAALVGASSADEVRAIFKRELVDGIGNPLPEPEAVTIDIPEIFAALDEWDETMPDYAGLLDAEVIE